MKHQTHFTKKKPISFFGKILFVLLFAVFVQTEKGFGQLLTEPFNYTPHATDGLSKQSSNVWRVFNTGDSILVAAGNLSYAGLAVSTGNSVTYGGTGSDNYTTFTSQTTGTVYYSFLLNVSSLGSLNTTGGYTTGFIDGGTSAFTGRVWLRSSGANYNIGVNPGTVSANTAWLPTAMSVNTTYLVVVSMEFVAGVNNDVAKIWLNPASLGGSTPAFDGTAINAGATTDPTSIQRVFLRQDNATNTPGTLVIDEIRIGTSWADVTPTAGGTATLANITQPSGDILQGTNDVVLAGFTLGATVSADFSSVTVTGAGTATSTDLSSVRIFRDNDGNGAINGLDASVSGSGLTYSGSMVFTITGETGITTARNYLIVANIAGVGVSTPGNTVTASVGSGAFTTTATTNTGSASGVSRMIAAANAPLITLTGTLTPFTTTAGTPSASQSYTVEGSNLQADILITPPSEFEIRTGANAFSNSAITLTQTGGTVATTTIDVRYNPAVGGSHSGNITHTSTNATQKNQPVSGSSLSAEPTLQSTVTFGPVTNSTIEINFSGGNGSARIVVVRNAGAVSYTPTDGFAPTGVNSNYFLATDKGSGNKIVYDGIGNTVTVSGLDQTTAYHVAVYEYNGTAATTNYLITTPGINNTTTLARTVTPVPMASQSLFTYTENFADIANWGNGFNFGTGTAPWSSVGVNGAGTVPDGVRTTTSTATFSTGSSGGVQRGSATGNVAGTIVQLSTGSGDNSTANAIEIFLDYTGVGAGTLSFNWGTVINGSGDRASSLRVYTSTNGITYTELPAAAVLNKPNGVTATGSITSVQLPASFSNSATARIRFYEYNGTGGTTGSRAKISIDDLVVTASIPPTKLAITNITPASPTQNAGFSVTVESHDLNNLPSNVLTNTNVSLTLNTGGGTLGGTLTGTILAGTSSVVISGVTYSAVENGVVITATRTAGDVLTAANSAPFNVVAPAPVITITGTLSPFQTGVGTQSASQTYTVQGLYLQSNIVITPPSPFEISLNNTTWVDNSGNISLTPSSGTVATTTIFVRYNPAAAGPHSGDITHTSTNATTQNQPVSGTTVATEPTTASTVTFGCPTTTTLTVNFTGGNGANRIVVARAGNSVSFTPTDGIAPSGVNSDFSLAVDQGSGNKIVYNGSGSTVTISGLTNATSYFVAVYEYNGSGSITEYLTTSFGSGDQSTLGSNPYSVTASTYTQDFDGLPLTGSFAIVGNGPHFVSACPINATNSTGWQFGKDPVTGGTGPGALFTVNDGAGFSGSAYSYGSTGSSDRALGSLASGGVVSTLGLTLVNNTPDALSSVTISYTGEQWRNGGSGIANSLLFSYSIGGTNIINGTFVTQPSLDFTSPVVNTTSSALNGDVSPNRTLITSTFTLNSNWLPGQTLILRWVDFNNAGSDDGLAIDEFSFTANTPAAPTVQDNNISFPFVSTNSATADWINGDGVNHLVKINTVNSFTDPINLTGYTANSVYGGGEQVVYNGTGSSVTVTGLAPGTQYFFRVYGFNGSGASARYLTATATLNPNSVTTLSPTPPTKLVILSVNGGVNPIVGQPFNVVVQAQDALDNPQGVLANTTVDLGVAQGTGTLSGTTSGIITAGTHTITITGVIYTPAENSVRLDATASAGDALATGVSAEFDVLDVASELQFVLVPTNGVVNTTVGTISVEARRPNGTVDANYTGPVTLSVNSGPGNITGTLIKNAIAGVATFNDIQFDATGNYTLLASAAGLTFDISSQIVITDTPVMTELVVPKFMGSKSAGSANTNRSPFAVCLRIDNLVPNTVYDLRAGLELSSGAASSYGAGNSWAGGQAFQSATIQNVFTTDGSGSSGPFWLYLQPTGNISRFGAAQVHNLRIGFVIDGQGNPPSAPNFVGAKLITALDIATTALTPTADDDGAFLHGVASECTGGKYILVYDNENGTGDPIFSYQARQAIPVDTTNSSYSGYLVDAPIIKDIYMQNGLSVVGDWPAIIPIGANNPNGVRRVEARNTDNTIFGFNTDDNGIWPSGANTLTNTRRSLTTLSPTDAPIASCGIAFTSNIILQGFYSGGGLMAVSGSGCLFTTGNSTDPADADTVYIHVMSAVSPYPEVEMQKGILKTNGAVAVAFTDAVQAGTSYYIKITHRNSVETWSKFPVLFSASTNYPFTTAASQAFADNLIETFDAMGWAIYAGDINHDGSVDGSDFLELDPSIQNGDGGYMIGDLNGDGSVDGSDFLVLDPNIQTGVGAAVPAP